jgi:hypothetical protein
MDKLSEISTATLEALARNWMLWVIILATLYAFSLYIYFFPTPLTQPFVSGPAAQSRAAIAAKNSIRR